MSLSSAITSRTSAEALGSQGPAGAGGCGGVGGLRPQRASQSKQVLQQYPIIHGFALVSHLPHDFCCAQVYLSEGGVSAHGGADAAEGRADVD